MVTRKQNTYTPGVIVFSRERGWIELIVSAEIISEKVIETTSIFVRTLTKDKVTVNVQSIRSSMAELDKYDIITHDSRLEYGSFLGLG
jgi:hypothetical protein